MTGGCGQAFIPEALHSGHELTLYARSPSKFSEEITSHSNVHVVQGDFNDMDAVQRAIAGGADAMVSFAGPDPSSKELVL
jgi:putative NADH-flavin reductase